MHGEGVWDQPVRYCIAPGAEGAGGAGSGADATCGMRQVFRSSDGDTFTGEFADGKPVATGRLEQRIGDGEASVRYVVAYDGLRSFHEGARSRARAPRARACAREREGANKASRRDEDPPRGAERRLALVRAPLCQGGARAQARGPPRRCGADDQGARGAGGDRGPAHARRGAF